MLQTYLSARLFINLADVNIIYRDFSYIGYTKTNEREAPVEDRYPYYGIAAVEKCMDYINFYCKVSRKDSEEIVKEIIYMNKKIEDSKIIVQSNLEKVKNRINKNVSGYPQKEIETAWRNTYFSCYPKIQAIKKILILSMPHAIIIYLRNLQNIYFKYKNN
jgi:hypothetical protein